MNEVEALKQKIEVLESQLEEQKKMHELQLSKIKSENYEALEASQTRYQGLTCNQQPLITSERLFSLFLAIIATSNGPFDK